MSFEDGAQDHSFDLMALEDAMKELYASSKCTKLTNVQSFLWICAQCMESITSL